MVWGERRGLASLLLTKPSGKNIEWAFYAFGGVMAWSWIASLIAPQEDNEGVGIITSMSIPGVILLITTAAVSLVIFIAPHVVFFGPSWLFHQLVGSLALVAFTLIRRNLVATMFLHMLVNAPILTPTVLAKL